MKSRRVHDEMSPVTKSAVFPCALKLEIIAMLISVMRSLSMTSRTWTPATRILSFEGIFNECLPNGIYKQVLRIFMTDR